jgi:hypothetical protein
LKNPICLTAALWNCELPATAVLLRIPGLTLLGVTTALQATQPWLHPPCTIQPPTQPNSAVLPTLPSPAAVSPSVCFFWAYYGIMFWAPMLTNMVLGRELTGKTTSVASYLLTAIPFACAALWLVRRAAQRTRHPALHCLRQPHGARAALSTHVQMESVCRAAGATPDAPTCTACLHPAGALCVALPAPR